MVRVKRGVQATRKRNQTLKRTKGFRGSSKTKERQARERTLHALQHAYVGRKLKKREFRTAWDVKINAAAREHGTTYSKLMHSLKLKQIKLDRKVLAYFAEHEPKVFAAIVKETLKK